MFMKLEFGGRNCASCTLATLTKPNKSLVARLSWGHIEHHPPAALEGLHSELDETFGAIDAAVPIGRASQKRSDCVASPIFVDPHNAPVTLPPTVTRSQEILHDILQVIVGYERLSPRGQSEMNCAGQPHGYELADRRHFN